MINDVLLRERAPGHSQHVYSLRSDSRGDFLLRGHLYDFCEISGNGLGARVTFEFELCDSKTGFVIWSRSYSHDEAVDGNDVTAVVPPMDHSFHRGLSEIKGGQEQYFSAYSQALGVVIVMYNAANCRSSHCLTRGVHSSPSSHRQSCPLTCNNDWHGQRSKNYLATDTNWPCRMVLSRLGRNRLPNAETTWIS